MTSDAEEKMGRCVMCGEQTPMWTSDPFGNTDEESSYFVCSDKCTSSVQGESARFDDGGRGRRW